ncbi:MAG: type II toxin-antitoxin system HigB family toxin [Bacteroidetes bacterium]|nr:MAG: type II toxin-antitoxin system HigB family toxin [Bacteroidota bacterium]
MRVIKEKTLAEYCNHVSYWRAKESLQSWVYEVRYSKWSNAGELKLKFRNASIINAKRVVFIIKGNDFRLIVDIEYKLGIIFIVWFGTHKEYDKIDVKTVDYDS